MVYIRWLARATRAHKTEQARSLAKPGPRKRMAPAFFGSQAQVRTMASGSLAKAQEQATKHPHLISSSLIRYWPPNQIGP